MTSAYGWLILKKLPKTVSGQMNCEQDGSHQWFVVGPAKATW